MPRDINQPLPEKTVPDWITRILNRMDVDAFITEIKGEPAIWDCTTEANSNSVLKELAWTHVYSTVDKNYEDRTPEEKQEFSKQLQRRWRSYRDCYRRELKRVRKLTDFELSGRKVYKHFEQLSFLKPVIGLGRPLIQYEGSGGCIEQKDVELWDFTDSLGTETPKRKRKQEDDESFTLEQEQDSGSKSKEHIIETYTAASDGDTLFLMSLVPEIKKIPENKRMHVKVQLMNVILEAQNS